MSNPSQSTGDPRTSERRRCGRYRVPCAGIRLEDDKGRIILDISERGMSIQAVETLIGGASQPMRFQLSESEAFIEPRARIAWTNTSSAIAGIEFVDLPDEQRDQIMQWISSRLQVKESEEAPGRDKSERARNFPAKERSGTVIPVIERRPRKDLPDNQCPPSIVDHPVEDSARTYKSLSCPELKPSTPDSSERTHEATGRLVRSYLESRIGRKIKGHKRPIFSHASVRLIVVAMGTVLLVLSVSLLAYHLQESRHVAQTVKAFASLKTPDLPPDPPVPPADPPVDTAAALHTPRFFLQVGATTRKEDADSLAKSLRLKAFPAFVYFRGTDRFYRVIVGPYTDGAATLRAEKELRQHGIESFRVRPNPPAK